VEEEVVLLSVEWAVAAVVPLGVEEGTECSMLHLSRLLRFLSILEGSWTG
jgi:hypothetical protein